MHKIAVVSTSVICPHMKAQGHIQYASRACLGPEAFPILEEEAKIKVPLKKKTKPKTTGPPWHSPLPGKGPRPNTAWQMLFLAVQHGMSLREGLYRAVLALGVD